MDDAGDEQQGGWGAFAAPTGTGQAPIASPAPPVAPPGWPGPPPLGGPPAPAGPPAPVWKLVLAPVAALLAATALALLVGVVAFYATGGGSSEGLDSLGPALLAFGAGIVAGAIASILLLVAAARRVLPAGRRVGAVLGSLLAFPVAGVLLGVLAGTDREGSWPIRVGDGLVQVVLLLAPSTAFLVSGRGASTRPRGGGRRDPGALAGLVALLLIGALVVSTVVLSVAGRGVARSNHAKTLGSVPYVLFRPATGGPPTADPGIGGWQRSPEDVAFVQRLQNGQEGAGQVGAASLGLRYFLAGNGLASVQMFSSLAPCSPDRVRGFVCESVGREGENEVRLYSRTSTAGAGALTAMALAFPDGSGVAVSMRTRGDGGDGLSGADGATGQATARAVLSEVVRVPLGQYESATGTTVKTY